MQMEYTKQRRIKPVSYTHLGKYHYCPLFDNGEGLMLDNVKYPFDVETRGLMKHLRAKPFQCRFGTVLSAARDLYGAQLKIACSAAEISEIEMCIRDRSILRHRWIPLHSIHI